MMAIDPTLFEDPVEHYTEMVNASERALVEMREVLRTAECGGEAMICCYQHSFRSWMKTLEALLDGALDQRDYESLEFYGQDDV